MPETNEPETQVSGHILAIDPGSDKCGVAVVDVADGGLRTVVKQVVLAGELQARVRALIDEYPIKTVVVGDRTGGKAFARELARSGAIAGDRRIVLVDEHLSSQEARRRYLSDHPGRGLWRFLPDSLRTPAEPFDDYVAEILAERYVQRYLRSGDTPRETTPDAPSSNPS